MYARRICCHAQPYPCSVVVPLLYVNLGRACKSHRLLPMAARLGQRGTAQAGRGLVGTLALDSRGDGGEQRIRAGGQRPPNSPLAR
jgi:hypothetical protein